MDIFWAIILFMLGTEIGSFLNVVIDRLPVGGSLLGPPSHCENCKTRLKVTDLIPLVSYLWLKGKCRYCGISITPRIFLVELATGLTVMSLWIGYGWEHNFWIFAVYSCFFIPVFVIDINTGYILDKITIPACIFALATVPLRDDLNYIDSVTNNIFIGGLAGAGFLLLIFILSRGGMGIGDIKFTGLMGLALGFPLVFVGLFISIMAGGIVATVLLIMKRKGRKQKVPFGPFLVIGTMTALLWGQSLWDWYIP